MDIDISVLSSELTLGNALNEIHPCRLLRHYCASSLFDRIYFVGGSIGVTADDDKMRVSDPSATENNRMGNEVFPCLTGGSCLWATGRRS